MSDLSIKGNIKYILSPESGTSKAGKEWSKQDFVIETTDEYPKLICFTLFGDKAKQLDGLGIGSTADVHFNLESREYNGKYFHNVNAWKVDGVSHMENDTTNQKESNTNSPNTEEGEDDLPF